jgi:thymidylate kinase
MKAVSLAVADEAPLRAGDVPRALAALLETLDRAGASYVVLRDGAELCELGSGGEVDILVAPEHLRTVADSASSTGFVPLGAWGHSPHSFFVHYDSDLDCCIKCDVTTAVSFGRPVPNLVTELAEACLSGRVRRGAVATPCAEDELIVLLLHCVLDKQQFQPQRVARLKKLRREVADQRRLQAHLARYWPWTTWPQLAAAIDHDWWPSLLGQREGLVAHLRRRDRLGTIVRGLRDRTLRKVQRVVGFVVPRGLGVAMLAPDGAGKSTLVAGLRAGPWFTTVHPVYMGLHQGSSQTPLSNRIPGLGLLRSLMTQWRRYLSARRHLAAGRLVLFDRYTHDALLPPARSRGLLGNARRWALAHACPEPDLVVVLDVPGDVLFARKGERTPSVLEEQRQSYREICQRSRHGVLVDACCDAGQLRRRVTALMWDRYRAKNGRARFHDGR